MEQIKSVDDKNRALTILENAFINVPGVMWMIRSQAKSHLRLLLSVCLHEACLKNGAFLTSDRNGVILFYRLEKKPKSLIILFKKLYLLIKVMGIHHGLRVLRSRKIIEQIRPKKGWYGWFIATDRSVGGCTSAREIMSEIFRISSMTNEPVYAETTLQRIAKFYEKIGFYVYAKRKHPYQDIDIWFMKRDPAPFLTK